MQDLDIKLDRLADGELNREEYAALLSSLDQHDEGWKRCALALLEGQALRTELRDLVAETPEEPKAQPKPPSRTYGIWPQLLTLAACLGLTFWLGRNSISVPAASSPEREQVAHVDRSQVPNTRPHQGEISLVVSGVDGQPRTMQVPVVDGERVDPRWVLSRSATIPPEVLAAIEQAGHRIETRREFLRQKVDDQHEVVLPIDRLRVVPVANPMY